MAEKIGGIQRCEKEGESEKKKMVPRAEVKGKKGLTILNDTDLKTKAMNK